MTSTKLNKITQGLKLALVVGATISSQQVTAQETQQAEGVETIEIRGLRASTQADLNNKRFADGILDSITAEDIGKLPDLTLADTLQRVAGVQITRSAGEGSAVNIRGVGEVGTLLNGEQFLSAGSITTVQPNFSDISSSLVSGIDVHKSPTSKILAGGISGTLDLKTIRPFDLKEGFTYVGSAELTRGNYTKENDKKITSFFGYNDEKFGVTASISWDTNTLANYRLGTPNIGWSGAQTEGDAWDGIGEDRTGDGDKNDALVTFIGYGNMGRQSERERLGVVTTLQAQLSDSIQMVADVFYTEMDDADRSIGMVADNAWGYFGWEEHGSDLVKRGVISDGGLAGADLYTSNTGVLNAPRVASTSESRTNDRDSLNMNLEFTFDNGGPLSGSVRYLHGEGQRETTHNIVQAFLTDGSRQNLFRNDGTGEIPVHPEGYSDLVPIERDFSGKHPQLKLPSLGGGMSDYAIVSTYSEENYYEEATLDVLRADGTYEFDTSHLRAVEFGVRKGKRDVTRDTYVLLAPINQDGLSNDVMWKDQGEVANDTNGDGEFSRAGGDKTIGYDNYLNFANLPSSWVIQSGDFGPVNVGNFYFINPEILDDHIGFQNELYPGNFKASQPGDSYKVQENTKSAYFNVKLDGQLGEMPYKANVGLQYIKTDLNVVQNLLGSDVICRACPGIVADVGDVVTDRSFSDTLPSVNFKLNLTDELIARASYGKTMTRLNTRNLGAGMTVNSTINQGEVSDVPVGERYAVEANRGGNPNLAPTRATNHDLTLEWYFTDSGLLSVAWFKMDVDSYIATDVTREYVPDPSDGVVRRQVDVRGPVNGDGGSIKGWEFAYQQGFDFLPGFWSGFGAGLNYTYAPSTSDTLDFEGNELPLAENSENSGNAVLWYEKDGWQFRIAANYRSERFIGQNGRNFGGGGLALFAKPTTYVDMSASYDFNDNISVYFSGSNLTKEFEDQYFQWEDYTVAQDIYERRLTMGVRGRW
ncbi:TonB-dependent receptor [Bowmanella denitrificans]|uniref:TonB-dependent receptor n=1 Tax=Bowmanella denitrificans TaxID=366582 RepID=A0ABP3GL00_9ALTE